MISRSKQAKGKRGLAAQVDYIALSRDLVDAVESGVYIVQSRKFVYVNPFFSKLTGYSREELIGTLSSKLILPQDRPAVRKKARRNLKSRLGSKPYEYRFIKKNGEIMWVMERVSSIVYMGKQAALGNCVDITDRKLAEQARDKSEEAYRLLAENSNDMIVTIDMNSNLTCLSIPRELAKSFTREEVEKLPIDELMTPESVNRLLDILPRAFEDALEGRDISDMHNDVELEVYCKDNSTIWTENRFTLIMDEEGLSISLLMQGRDITDRKLAELARDESEKNYRLLAEHMTDSVWLMDMQLNTTYMSPSAEKLRGYTQQEIRELPPEKALTPESVKLGTEVLLEEQAKMEADPNYNFKRTLELELYRKDGTTIWTENTFSLIRDENGNPVSILGEGRDISERKQLQKKLEEMATHDFLTGLPNRVLLLDRFTIAAALAQRKKFRIAVMSLDLDKFKTINDTLGHDAGDYVLKTISMRLSGLIRASDTLARVGGDEFILVTLETSQMQDATAVAQKFLDSFKEPLVIDSRQIYLSTSIGIAIYPEDGQYLEILTRKSDAAMYYSKGHGRNQFKFFSDGDVGIGQDHKSGN
ncbi:MAG: PAS domain S-box protein [Dehalococcoidia bacterium]|nr:PAS domain S-box protein [Dehalococcoidia bacterium]